MKTHLLIAITLLISNVLTAQIRAKTIVKDFKKLEGSWQGSLTYLDYSSAKPYTMDANVEVAQLKQSNQFAFANIYPKEASANNTDTVTVADDGKLINKAVVKSRNKYANGNTEIITEEPGTDGNDDKAAILKHTYTFSKTSFSIRTDVQFVGTNEWIKRHEYSYMRKE
jgi:hypothetical protein